MLINWRIRLACCIPLLLLVAMLTKQLINIDAEQDSCYTMKKGDREI